MQTDFNAVLDEFKRQDREWVGIAVVEASLSGLRFYRWMSDGKLGVAENCGITLRPATDREYGELEEGICKGKVRITRYNRISRETITIFPKE